VKFLSALRVIEVFVFLIVRLLGFAEFETWNMLDFLPDRFIYPTKPRAFGTKVDPKTDPWAVYVISRCWLEIGSIVQKLAQLRHEHANEMQLRRVYISTNGDTEWVNALRKSLLESGWESVFSTHDLQLTWKESGVDGVVGESWVSSYLEVVHKF